jgi:hypothetical protein
MYQQLVQIPLTTLPAAIKGLAERGAGSAQMASAGRLETEAAGLGVREAVNMRCGMRGGDAATCDRPKKREPVSDPS